MVSYLIIVVVILILINYRIHSLTAIYMKIFEELTIIYIYD